MKLKLLVVSILALLSLVAYQKYSEYSALKSINSYESCASAKGSTIQESYPATCVTRLGSRFTQVIDQLTTKTYTNSVMKVSFDYPSSLIAFGNDTSLGVSLGAPETGGLGFEVNMIKNKSVNNLFAEDKLKFEGYLESSNKPPSLKATTINNYQARETVFKNAAYGVDIRSIYFQRDVDVVNILLPAYEESPSNQILSTFKFTN